MEKLEKYKKQKDYVEVVSLPDGKTVEIHFQPENKEQAKEYLIKNEFGEITKFANLNFNKELFDMIKNSCLEKGIILKNEELEKLSEKKADALLNQIDEDKTTEN